jgi:uncharacterized membrane protein YkoI
MKLSYIRLAALGISMSVAASSIALAGAKDDAALAKAPAAVQAAAKKALGDKKLEEFGKESVGGKILYEVGFKVGAVDHAYIVSEAGDLVQEEEDVEVAKLPAPVLEAVKKAQPDGKIDEAALATAGKKTFYEVDVKVGKDVHALKISKKGKLISDEIEKSLDGEKPEADEKK